MTLNPSARDLRLGVLIAALLVAAVILASAWSDWLAARKTAAALVLGEGEQLGALLRHALADVPPPVTDDDLRRVLDEQPEKGLYALLILGEECDVLASAGDSRLFNPISPCVGPDCSIFDPGSESPLPAPLSACEPPPMLTGQGRAIGHQPLQRTGGRPPPDGSPRTRPPELVFEFDAQLARALHARAMRSLGLGLTVALALLMGAGAFWRLSRRAEAMEGRGNLEKHLATLGEMSAVLAHEIRNPLASLKGNAQLLAEELAGAQQERAQWVVAEAQRLEALTHTLLQFVRSGSVARELADPAQVVRDAVREVGPEAFEVDIRDVPASWALDPLRVHQALSNLLRNALQAEGSRPPIITLTQEEGALVFQVRDFGPGIPAGHEAQIFEPFHTTRTQGTGLGLGVVRRVALLHGGTVQVANHPDSGAVFTLRLPKGAS